MSETTDGHLNGLNEDLLFNQAQIRLVTRDSLQKNLQKLVAVRDLSLSLQYSAISSYSALGSIIVHPASVNTQNAVHSAGSVM